jgi:hypothetical protein
VLPKLKKEEVKVARHIDIAWSQAEPRAL